MVPLGADRPKEECGVVGVYTPQRDAARLTFFALFALQHRGQESAGMAVEDGGVIHMEKGMGLVSQVFNESVLATLPGPMAIGHTRYSTTGASVVRNAQPVTCLSSSGQIAIAHNGNLVNAASLRHELTELGEVFNGTNDSEVVARLLAREMHRGLEGAVEELMRRLHGAYSIVGLVPGCIFAFRDPSGVRPLVVGEVPGGTMFASETCAFGPVGGSPSRELEPGELAILDANGLRFHRAAPKGREALCMFEFIYFARPDSVMYGTPLYAARERMGGELAREHPVEADIVIPVPDSGIPAALGYSRASDIPFREGMMKSRYIHRTFIQPDPEQRKMGVRMKLTPLVDHIRGQRVVLVDDSIVRATTTSQIVGMLFEAGALEVHVRITAPPIKWPCFYGIDMANRRELAAAKWSVEEIRERLGASSLGYLSVEGTVRAVGEPANRFCLACFTGDYPIPVPDENSKEMFEMGPDAGQFGTVDREQLRLFHEAPTSG